MGNYKGPYQLQIRLLGKDGEELDEIASSKIFIKVDTTFFIAAVNSLDMLLKRNSDRLLYLYEVDPNEFAEGAIAASEFGYRAAHEWLMEKPVDYRRRIAKTAQGNTQDQESSESEAE